MAEKKMKGCLQLNQHLIQALSQQVEGAPTKRDQILLLTQAKLLDVLKESLKDSNVQPLFDLQTELSRIVAADQIDMEEVFRYHQLVSKAMRNNSKRETLILVNMELSQAMMDGSQDVIREKLISVLRLLSQGMIDCTGNEAVEALFKLNEALSQAIVEKSEDKKLGLLTNSNLLLAEFMAAGYQDTSTEWLMELNRLAALALVLRVKNPTFIQKSIHVLSGEMRKSSDEVVFKDSMELIFTLSSMLVEADVESSFLDQLVTWKIQLSNVMLELLGESSKVAIKKARDEGIAVQTAALEAENRKLRDELAELVQLTDASREETRKLKGKEVELSQELLRSKEIVAELVSGIAKLKGNLSINEEKENEQILNENNNLSTQKGEASEEGRKIPEGAEIGKAWFNVAEVKSEAPVVEEEKVIAGSTRTSSPAKKQNVGGEGGSGTGGVTCSTAKFPAKVRRSRVLGGKRDPMNEVYLPPVTSHKGNKATSPRDQGLKSKQKETP